MPGAWDLFFDVYQNSGPALQLALLAIIAVGWERHVKPRLDRLERVQRDHADDLQDRALNHAERDVMLEKAHERLDRASDARKSLRERLRYVERRVNQDEPPRDEEMEERLGDRNRPADD